MKLYNRKEFLIESVDLNFNLDDIKNLPEYKKIIDLGFTDISSDIQKKRLNFNFQYSGDFRINGKLNPKYKDCLNVCKNYTLSTHWHGAVNYDDKNKIDDDQLLLKYRKSLMNNDLDHDTLNNRFLDLYAKDNIFVYGFTLSKSGNIRVIKEYDTDARLPTFGNIKMSERKTLEDYKEIFSKAITLAEKIKTKFSLF